MWGYFPSCSIRKMTQGPEVLTMSGTQVELGHRAGGWEGQGAEREGSKGRGGGGKRVPALKDKPAPGWQCTLCWSSWLPPSL